LGDPRFPNKLLMAADIASIPSPHHLYLGPWPHSTPKLKILHVCFQNLPGDIPGPQNGRGDLSYSPHPAWPFVVYRGHCPRSWGLRVAEIVKSWKSYTCFSADYLNEEMMGWQWNQLDHMPIICILLQTYNCASTSSLNVLQA